jgi:hypothetical protein
MLRSLVGRHGLSGDVTMDPLHWIGRGERGRAREHLVVRDAREQLWARTSTRTGFGNPENRPDRGASRIGTPR